MSGVGDLWRDDAHLIDRCRSGEPRAQADVARRAATLALRTAAMAMGDVEAAKDVSQEVAVRALRGVGKLRDPNRFEAWIYRITVSEIRRAYRRGRRHAVVPLEPAAAEALGATANEPAARIESLALRADLRGALAELSVRERTALALRYVHDLPDDEIAEAMQCRPGTVRSLISRAAARLRVHPALAPGRTSSLPIPKETLS